MIKIAIELSEKCGNEYLFNIDAGKTELQQNNDGFRLYDIYNMKEPTSKKKYYKSKINVLFFSINNHTTFDCDIYAQYTEFAHLKLSVSYEKI